jgi:hypothetical protein
MYTPSLSRRFLRVNKAHKLLHYLYKGGLAVTSILYQEIEQPRQQLDLYFCSAVVISMASKPDLVKYALDAFKIIDDHAGRARRPGKEPAVITDEEAAKRFGGVVIKGKGNRGNAALQK